VLAAFAALSAAAFFAFSPNDKARRPVRLHCGAHRAAHRNMLAQGRAATLALGRRLKDLR
jgi:hypothetical protein